MQLHTVNAAESANWEVYGANSDETHYSPLRDITAGNVSRLGLVWSFDIPGVVLSSSVPLEVNGKEYFTTGYSVVHAVDAATGKLLWEFDPKVPEIAGRKLRLMWGVRGLAFWKDRVYVGTHDGRLICIDAQNGRPVWSVNTTEPGDNRIITGPPLVFGDQVLIGHGVNEYGPVRGYVTAYRAETGARTWRFYTVPGDPKKGFENAAMKLAATTWTGEWWKGGGGGAVWNAMTYDRELNRVYIGTGNGSPWFAASRSPKGGDSLFTASIVALDANTGQYVWHYQTNPNDTWDYDATEDIELAHVVINGKNRRVLFQASKNGFFYVIDRDSGKLVTANKFCTVTWADHIDLQSGRPVETADARDLSPDWPGEHIIWPSPDGGHNLQPMAYSPETGLAYFPSLDQSSDYHEGEGKFDIQRAAAGFLIAWRPMDGQLAWRIALPKPWNGGVMATAGNLVFQGRGDGQFVAYTADTGKQVWSFDAQTGIVGAPISYEIGKRQYVSVMVGFTGVPAMTDGTWNARTQARRLLTFSLDGNAHLPPSNSRGGVTAVNEESFRIDPSTQRRGSEAFGENCEICHGRNAVAGGAAPDLRGSPLILSPAAFRQVVKGGVLLEQGMPRFEDLKDQELEDIRQYLRERASELRSEAGQNH